MVDERSAWQAPTKRPARAFGLWLGRVERIFGTHRSRRWELNQTGLKQALGFPARPAVPVARIGTASKATSAGRTDYRVTTSKRLVIVLEGRTGVALPAAENSRPRLKRSIGLGMATERAVGTNMVRLGALQFSGDYE